MFVVLEQQALITQSIVEILASLNAESRRSSQLEAFRFGLTSSQMVVMKRLESDGELSLSELSLRIRARNSTVTGIVGRMQRMGLLIRTRSVKDRRVVRVHLTPKGKALAQGISRQSTEVFCQALESLSHKELSDLFRTLSKIESRVRSLVDAPSKDFLLNDGAGR